MNLFIFLLRYIPASPIHRQIIESNEKSLKFICQSKKGEFHRTVPPKNHCTFCLYLENTKTRLLLRIFRGSGYCVLQPTSIQTCLRTRVWQQMNLQKVFSKLQKVYLLRSGQSVQTISAILIFSKRSKKGDDLNINTFNISDKVALVVLVKRLESKFFL